MESETELEVTRQKLEKLRRRREQVGRDSCDGPICELTLQSRGRMINQFEEEIALYRSRVSVAE